MSNTVVLTAIASHKALVINTCLETMYDDQIEIDKVASDACKDMTDFIATLTPVQPKAVTVIATTANPLSNQLKALTGDGWNWFDWEGDLTDSNNIIKHIKTGLVVQVL